MAPETIDDILKRKQSEKTAAPPSPEADKQEDKFFSILVGEGVQENFLELQFRDGVRTCLSYTDLMWFNYSPDEGLDLEFGGFLISIKGRGLMPKLFNGIKQKRVAWLKESDVELQNHKDNETFIETITITPPKGFTEEENQPAE